MSAVYQGLPESREVAFGGVRLGWIGRTVVFGRTCLLLRTDSMDIELVISLAGYDDEASFVVSGPFQARYRTFPADHPVDGELAGALKALCLHVMAGMDVESSEPPEPLESETGQVLTRILSLNGHHVGPRESSGGMYRLNLPSDSGEPPAELLVRAGRGGPGSFMGWSFDVVSRRAFSEKALKRIRGYVLEIAAGLGISVVSGQHDHAADVPVTKILIDMAAPLSADVLDTLGRAGNINLSLLFSGDCLQACSFCTVSEIRSFRQQTIGENNIGMVVATLLERQKQYPGGLDLRLAGSDPLALPIRELAYLLGALSQLEIGAATICTPALHLADPLYIRCIGNNLNHAVIETTLHGPDPEIHDKVCGVDGSFDILMRALANCRQAGIRVVLNHVIVRDNQDCLSMTLARAYSLGMRLRLMMFIPVEGVSGTVVDRSLPSLALLRDFLQDNRALVMSSVDEFLNIPLCVIPEWARAISTGWATPWPDPIVDSVKPCSGCVKFHSPCPGPNCGHLVRHGRSGLSALRDS